MVTIDFETKSYADLTKVGAWNYFSHSTTEIICVCYIIEDRLPPQSWWPGKPLKGAQKWPKGASALVSGVISENMPYDLYKAVREQQLVEAHNVAFEYSGWVLLLAKLFGWIVPLAKQWRDTMAVAGYYAMPGPLDKLAKALGYGGKNPVGTRLISKYSKLYLKTAKERIPVRDFLLFVEYCKEDVFLEWSISNYLGGLPPEELEIFLLDQVINKRGIYLNKKSIDDAAYIVNIRARELAEEFRSITGVNPTQNEKARLWFSKKGYPLLNMQADYIEEVLAGDRDFEIEEEEVRRALEVRVKYNKASTKKLSAMLRHRSSDGRAKFQLRYHGAGTGRWTGSGFQPLNLAQSYEDVPPEKLLKDISYRDPRWLDIMYGDAMQAVSKASRHHIQAEEGNRLMAGDYVSIEAVLLSCLAGEEWKVKAFRNKEPIYELMGCEIHKLGREARELALRDKKAFKEKYPEERFDGKTGELAFGFQGALGAWRKFDTSDRHSDERIIEICKAWRGKHPAVVDFWYDMERAAIDCLDQRKETECRDISFKLMDDWLSMRVPSGKRIWYFAPELRMGMPQWHDPEKKEECRDGTCSCEPRVQLTYMAWKEGQWKRVNTYGGKLAENATQTVSRQVLTPAMIALEKAGYPIIFSVYDEIVSERKKREGSTKEFSEIMLDVDRWAEEYPINVDVWEGASYKK